MSLPQDNIYTFGRFRFESDKLVLWHDQNPIKNLGLQPLKILAALLRHEGVVTYDEIIEEAWPEQKQENVYDTNIKPHISALRRVFAEFEPDSNYIQTFPSRGYSFVGAKLTAAIDFHEQPEQNIEAAGANSHAAQEEETPGEKEPGANPGTPLPAAKAGRSVKPAHIIFAALFLILLITGIFLWRNFSSVQTQSEGRVTVQSTADEEMIRRVVEESQNYETLTVYTNPQAFDEQTLKQYFVEPAEGGQEPQKIKKAVENLMQKGLHYGPESRQELFNFLSVNIYSPGDYAEVQTEESWYIPVYHNDGTRNPDTNVRLKVKPTYYLKKIQGRWFIEENTTARKKPSPSR